jgi:hypothetical protein
MDPMENEAMNNPKDHFVSFGDAAHILGIIDDDFLQWVKEDNPEIGKDYLNKDAIRYSYLEYCADRDDYLEKLEQSFGLEIIEIINSLKKDKFYKEERLYLIDLYTNFISELISLHQKYAKRAERHGIESPVLAAYLLFSKAISVLSCLCDNLKQGYWYVGSMLREIDETLDVALYFILSKDNDSGKFDLKKWYRLGFSPPHRKCRKVIAEWHSKLINNDNNHENLMINLYKIKSKFIHPTFNVIRDCSVISYNQGEVTIENLCYGVSAREQRLWELTHFTKSSIWTCFQQFLIIFAHSMPLEQTDINYLRQYNRKFAELDSKLEW